MIAYYTIPSACWALGDVETSIVKAHLSQMIQSVASARGGGLNQYGSI